MRKILAVLQPKTAKWHQDTSLLPYFRPRHSALRRDFGRKLDVVVACGASGWI
jgi:hypothetical protein